LLTSVLRLVLLNSVLKSLLKAVGVEIDVNIGRC
jgi:hypothetical protein